MKFQPGMSGNEKGRPRGSGHRQQLFNKLVEPRKEELFEKAINLALSGNDLMLKLFLERMLPSRPTDDAVSLDITGMDLTKVESLLAAGKTILEGVAAAEITPSQGKALMGVVGAQTKQIEAHELSQRVAAMERTLNKRKQGV